MKRAGWALDCLAATLVTAAVVVALWTWPGLPAWPVIAGGAAVVIALAAGEWRDDLRRGRKDP